MSQSNLNYIQYQHKHVAHVTDKLDMPCSSELKQEEQEEKFLQILHKMAKVVYKIALVSMSDLIKNNLKQCLNFFLF